MSHSYCINPATIHDVDALSVLVNSAYRGESSRLGWTTEADFLDGQRTDPQSLLEDITGTDRTILCLRQREGGPILGSVFLQISRKDPQNPYCYLGMLTISPELQNSGLGKILLQEAEAFAKKSGANRISLGVIHLRSTLIDWYLRRGYSPNGKTSAFPYHDERFGIPKRDDLHFVMFDKTL